jgi:hypothetical protein
MSGELEKRASDADREQIVDRPPRRGFTFARSG